jgi:hypothetical protein
LRRVTTLLLRVKSWLRWITALLRRISPLWTLWGVSLRRVTALLLRVEAGLRRISSLWALWGVTLRGS